MAKARKFNKDREWLIQEYVINDRPRKEVANECGLTEAGLKSVLLNLDVKKEKFVIKQPVLEDLVNQLLSAEDIAHKLGCHSTTVYRYLKKYNLKILAAHKEYIQYDSSNDDMICSLYIDGLSSTEIAKIFNTDHNTILYHLSHCEIPRRTLVESQWNYNDKEFPPDLKNYDIVYDMYITKGLSKKEIGIKYNCDPRVIDRVLQEFNIPIRGNSEAKRGKMVGEKHWNWQEGITGLHFRLREAFYVQQVPNILRRDNYCCQLCGSKQSLQVHHIKHFSEIFHRILNDNSELDPIEDQNILYDIALKDPEFTDENNLITYCKECHLFHIHGYKHRK